MTAQKILGLSQLAGILAGLKKQGRTVVHCHGVFDLLHIGHIKHLEAARKLGDVLVVTVTPDRFVKKGPHRPAFPERLRVEALASLACVDYAAVNEWPTAVETIKLLKPSLFVKGMVREEGKRDHSDAIEREETAIRDVGGRLVLTEEDTYSASTLINRHLDIFSPEVKEFLEGFRQRYTPEQVVGFLQNARNLRVLVVGETIIDEYHFCDILGKSSKEPVLAALHKYTERYPGGILAIANHLANFCDRVTLVSALGQEDSQEEFVRAHLRPNIDARFIPKAGYPTIIKQRYLEDYLAFKVFEVYIMKNELIQPTVEQKFCAALEQALPEHDLVVVADYGHGLMTPAAIDLVCTRSRHLAVNTQTNAGNRGFNSISKYPHADYVSIGEPEVRLDFRDLHGDLEAMIQKAAARIGSQRFLVTRGSRGSVCYDHREGLLTVPAFSIKVVDRIGAGDAVLAVTSACAATNVPSEAIGFIANVVGAEACGIMGNKTAIEPGSLFRHITSLMK